MKLLPTNQSLTPPDATIKRAGLQFMPTGTAARLVAYNGRIYRLPACLYYLRADDTVPQLISIEDAYGAACDEGTTPAAFLFSIHYFHQFSLNNARLFTAPYTVRPVAESASETRWEVYHELSRHVVAHSRNLHLINECAQALNRKYESQRAATSARELEAA